MKVSLIAAISADGYIARTRDELVDWTSKDDKKLFVEITKRAGVVIMGGNTFRTIGKALTGRHHIVYSRQELHRPDIEVTQESPPELIARLEQEGVRAVVICGGHAIYSMFLAADMVDEVYLTVEPTLFGQGVRLADSLLDVKLRLIHHELLNEDSVLLHYEIIKQENNREEIFTSK